MIIHILWKIHNYNGLYIAVEHHQHTYYFKNTCIVSAWKIRYDIFIWFTIQVGMFTITKRLPRLELLLSAMTVVPVFISTSDLPLDIFLGHQ